MLYLQSIDADTPNPDTPPGPEAGTQSTTSTRIRTGTVLCLTKKHPFCYLRVMSNPPRFYAACCQTDFPAPRSRQEISTRVDRMIEMIDGAVLGYEPFFPVRLVVFPEFAHSPPIYFSVRELIEHLAVPLPNEHTDRYMARAKHHGIFVQTGTFLERDDAYPDAVFNTTCLIGPTGILAKYRKTHPWIPWEVHASPHDLPQYADDPFPVAETEIGRLGAAICYDWLFPEAIRQLALKGAEVLIRVSAYMDPWGTANPMDWWTVVNRCRALENLAYVVAANQGARLENYPPFSWPGGSMIVDYDGRIIAQAESGPGERIVVGPIDVAALRAERARRRGHQILCHLRTELYGGYAEPIYPAASRAGNWPVSIDGNNRSIDAVRTHPAPTRNVKRNP
jgi:predicted amidohydrolase